MLEFRQLVNIFLADSLEQIFFVHRSHRYQYKDFFLKAKPFLGQKAYQEMSIAYFQPANTSGIAS